MKVIQVFEHETILVGDTLNGVLFDQKHYIYLSNRLGKKDHTTFPFYSLIKYRNRDGIKFNQYVGAIQAADLTIEILPKIDRGNESYDWKFALLYILSKVNKLNISSEGTTPQKLRSISILDFIFLRFLDETENILHQGLIKAYRTQDENLQSLKGKLLFTKQISRNLIHKERFYVRHTVYDRSHIMNRLLCQSLCCIANTSNNPTIRQRAVAYLEGFPNLDKIDVTETLFAHLKYDRKTERYRTAMSLAELILLNNMPSLNVGQKDTFAMLFDMNRLWEEFIYVTLRKYLNKQYIVSAQVNKRFWEKKHIKPDIVLKDMNDSSKIFILDTKWKKPEGKNPSDGDLHQMYVYYRYFNAKKVALLYPSTSISNPTIEGVFADGSDTPCDLLFLPIPQNYHTGKEWQQKITNAIENWLLKLN